MLPEACNNSPTLGGTQESSSAVPAPRPHAEAGEAANSTISKWTLLSAAGVTGKGTGVLSWQKPEKLSES